MPIQNRLALVTGGSRGLGRAMAQALARAGADVIVTWRNCQDEAEAACAEIRELGRRAAALQLNVGDVASFSRFRDELDAVLDGQFGRTDFDFLINNAGIGRRAPFVETTGEAFDALLNVHFRGVFFLTQQLLPRMADGGGIVFISSGLARFSIPGMSAYAAMKGAVEVLSRYLAKELGPRRIRSNVVAPGAIQTDFNAAYFKSRPEILAMLAEETALGRVGQPNDIGGVVAFLCSDEAQWVNGQRIEVSGGVQL